MQTNSDELLSLGEVSRRLGIPITTLSKWARQGVIPAPAFVGGGAWLYTPRQVADIEKIAATRRDANK